MTNQAKHPLVEIITGRSLFSPMVLVSINVRQDEESADFAVEAVVHWGDGSPESNVKIEKHQTEDFYAALASHRYAEKSEYPIKVLFLNNKGETITVTMIAND